MSADKRLALIQFKIDRAKKHIGDLDVAMRTFFDSKPYEISTKRDPETRKLIYYVSRVSPTPVCLATITGDIIQNLRSGLDHLAVQLFLVGTNGVSGGRHVYFPIAAGAAEYKSNFSRKTKGMRQDAVDALHVIEPYKGGKGNELWLIHELNNIDKHRLLVTVGSSFQSVNVGAIGTSMLEKLVGKPLPILDAFLKPADNLCPLKVGDELFIDAPDAKVNDKMDFRFNIALHEPGIIEGRFLLEAVRQFAEIVENTLLKFKACLV